MNVEITVIVGFLMSIFYFFAIVKLYDLNQQIKKCEKELLNIKFKRCYNRGKVKGIRIAQELIQGTK